VILNEVYSLNPNCGSNPLKPARRTELSAPPVYQGRDVGKMFFEGNEVGKAGCEAELENVTTHFVEDSIPQKAKWARVICSFPNVRRFPAMVINSRAR